MQSVVKLPNAAASQLTISSTAISLADAITAAASEAFSIGKDVNALDLQVESEAIRYLMDGNTPTTSVGMLLSATGIAIKTFRGEDLSKILMIATAADATVNITLGKTNPM